MMQGVVLHGTGTKAMLEGYSTAGKTGTAQKVDPATHAYSHTKYVATFAGFAPINNPAITVAVILDSAVGLHQGGQVCAPVFHRVAQQVLEYLHTPHDIELPPQRKMLLASRQVKDSDLSEGSPDHLGDTLDMAEATTPTPPVANPPVQPGTTSAAVMQAALKQREVVQAEQPAAVPVTQAPAPAVEPHPTNGTVVLDLEQGGIVVPSFAGKSVRAAIELAEESGLDLDAVGNGVAREQSPPAGTHVPSGAKVTVTFGR
jgi:cell division protein FtsI (penicillin-binding protein 3)